MGVVSFPPCKMHTAYIHDVSHREGLAVDYSPPVRYTRYSYGVSHREGCVHADTDTLPVG